MTTPDHRSPAPQPPEPTAKDRIHRSPMAIVGGVLLLGIGAWLGIDALVKGDGRTPWVALAGLLLVVPLVIAFTLRPAVFVNDDRLRVRNPFRLITLPWGQIAVLRSGYSHEAVTKSGATYQLWALPVSLRARKKATRRQARAEAEGRTGARPEGPGRGRGAGGLWGPTLTDGPTRAESDQIMDGLRRLQEDRERAETAQGEVTVRWAYEIVAPAAAGAVLLAVLLAMG
ncbi:PH domain-containing protein [Streptomyces sp. NPDC004542]|uniref:PH domain-containing protein n=1 Tax=Streptomyces sp. NPDC004542 TaxID=3154281 RepID=UPI00339F3BF3